MSIKTSSERLADAMQRARRHWESERQQEIPASPPGSRSGFTIALSREAGAGGSAVARFIGERLDWPVYDHELVERIAAELGLRTRLLESADEKRIGWLRECMTQLAGLPISDAGYRQRLVEILFALAAHGNCVIVGRGAAQLLPRDTTLRVRLIAPLRDRVNAVVIRRAVSFEQAVEWIEQKDRERAGFVRDLVSKDVADPSHYDLVLNSARFNTEECASIIVHALEQARGRRAGAEPMAAVN